MKTEMKMLLYIKRGVQDKDGFAPLMGRISVRGKVNQGRRIKMRCPVKVLTGIFHPILLSAF